MTSGEFVAARRALGYTQAQLGAKLDITRVHIGNLERGARPISTTTALAMRYLLLIRPVAGESENGTE